MRVFWLAIFILFFLGCQTPTEKNTNAEKKVTAAEKQLQTNEHETEKKAVGYVYSADFALSLDPNPSRFSNVAKDMTGRSLIITGPPSLQESLVFQEIVRQLTSTNEMLVKKGEEALAKKDREVVNLQSQVKGLEAKLEKVEESRKKLAAENASLASTWVMIKKWFRFILWGFLAVFVFRIVSHALPPPYNSIGFIVDGVAGLFGSVISKVLPKTLHYAGAVSKQAYDTSETTLKQLILALQEARRDNELKDRLDVLLKDKTDVSTRAKIIEVKKDLNLI